jgi:sec-independent protein translocase protein TatB
MFDIGWSELVLIGIIALVVIGPKELPGVLRMMGQWMTKIRRMASEFQGQFNEAMREAEMADLKKQVEQITDSARDLGTNFDPVETARREIEGTFEDKPKTDAQATAAPQEGDDRAAALAATPETPVPSEVETVPAPSDPPVRDAPEPPATPGSGGRAA